ncbi:4-alpha-glucanotransferase [Vibrio sp. RC27]
MELQQQTLLKVADLVGIAPRFTSMMGDESEVSQETITYILSELGYDTSSDGALLLSAEKKHKVDILDPLQVVYQYEPVEIELNLGVSARESEFEWQLVTECGQHFSGYLQSQVVRDDRAENGPLVFSIPVELPLGYHELSVLRKRRKTPYTATLVIAPRQCYQQPLLQQGKKIWGPSVQLYTLKTDHNWGMGDFGDLKHLVVEMADRGADFIGLNPIHALFPANPEGASPYSPSSRRWLNVFYLDVSSIPEFVFCNDAQQIVGSAEFQKKLEEARSAHWVNYSLVAQLKMQILPLLFAEFKHRHLETQSQRGQAFLSFVEQGGEDLLAQATFDALHTKLHQQDDQIWGWQVFPEQFRQFRSAGVSQFMSDEKDQVDFHLYLQWLSDTQLSEVQSLAKEKGMDLGLYRDLAVGVADSGAEVWADQGNLLTGLSIGAPPDQLGPLGQNWGLPPLNPQAMRSKAYKPFIELLRANMKNCGALRIDHVMGLLRLWWIPKGKSPQDGAYIYFPVKELIAILTLESQRNQCSVIGEDLGTVPPEIVSLLADAGIYSYKVFFFETAEDGGYISPNHYPPQAMSTLCTHDMPTLRGFWHCDDLKMGADIGLYPDEHKLKRLFDERLASKQAILESVDWHGYLPQCVGRDASLVPMDSTLSEGLHLHLAAGASALMSLQLEDLLEMDKPVNIPGTVDEYPNWRRKLNTTLEDLFTRDEVNHLMTRITMVRNQ